MQSNDDEESLIRTDVHEEETAVVTSAQTTLAPITAKSRFFILEPASYLIFFAFYVSAAVYQNQILYQTCTVVFQYNDTQCQPLLGLSRETEESKRIELEVQPYVTRIFMTRSFVESLMSALVSLFIGAWSDKFGRRPVILAAYTGFFLNMFINNIIVYLSSQLHISISPWWYMTASVPVILTGGACSLITGIFSYIADMAQGKQRAIKMVINDATLNAGTMTGTMLGGYLYPKTSVLFMMTLSTIAMSLSLLFIIFYVKESLKLEHTQAGSALKEFFRREIVVNVIETVKKRRAGIDRATIWIIFFIVSTNRFVGEGESNIFYLFLREKFDVTMPQFSVYSTVSLTTQIFSSIFAIMFMKKILKFSNFAIALVALSSSVLETTVRAFATYWWEMYLGIGLGCLRGGLTAMLRTALSFIVLPQETGTIFAFNSSLDSIAALSATPLYALVYDATIEFYPGLYNFISLTFYYVCFALLSTIFFWRKAIESSKS